MSRARLSWIALAAVLVALQLAFIATFKFYRVPARGMEPAIDVGENVLVRRTRDVARGDIIVFRNPARPDTDFLKRVVAVGGDRLEIRDKRVVLNGQTLAEPHAMYEDVAIYPKNAAMPEPYRSRDQFGPLVVPKDALFVLGDNRDHSYDSRWLGAVPRELVRGRVILVYSPRGLRRPVAPRSAPAPAPR